MNCVDNENIKSLCVDICRNSHCLNCPFYDGQCLVRLRGCSEAFRRLSAKEYSRSAMICSLTKQGAFNRYKYLFKRGILFK